MHRILFIIAVIAALVPIIITVFDLYGEHRLMDIVAHLSAGVSLGAGIELWEFFDIHPIMVLAIVALIAIGWEWLEPRFQEYVGPMTVGYEDTVGDILAVILGAALVLLAL